MPPKLTRQKDHLKMLLSIEKGWEFWVAGSTGIYTNKVSIHLHEGMILTVTRQELAQHIAVTKMNIRRTIGKYYK